MSTEEFRVGRYAVTVWGGGTALLVQRLEGDYRLEVAFLQGDEASEVTDVLYSPYRTEEENVETLEMYDYGYYVAGE